MSLIEGLSMAFSNYGYLHFTKSGYKENLKKFRAEDMQARMDGKNCIFTGANSGIGIATAEELASRGASVYMVCRSKERGEVALSKIQCSTGNHKVYLEVCDLSSVNEIKSFATKLSSKGVPIHVLVNNAGMLEHDHISTPEGSILCLLEKAAPDARVITVSSGGMYNAPLTKDLQVDPNWFSEGNFSGVMQYARNKRVQVALTEKWAEICKYKGIGFYSMHPGWVETPVVVRSLPEFAQKLSGELRTREEGADTIIWLALQPKEKLVSGGLYFDRVEAPKHLPLADTAGSHVIIDAITGILRSISGIPS